MGIFLILAFLFFIGSVSGWILELLYRNLTSKSKKWINPGFCAGPYVPLYGFGLCIIYLITSIEDSRIISNPFWNKLVLFAVMALCMTLIEYIAGVFCLKFLKVRLWDYSDRWGNIDGIICPTFSLAWAVLCAAYYFLIHPRILRALEWLSQNLAFSFIIGFFFGVFVIDVAHSAQLVTRLRKFALDNDIVLKYENIKEEIRGRQRRGMHHFFHPFRSDVPLMEHLKEMYSEKKNRA